jgi:uncharacterized coiled-coil DUF342 family protein
MKTILSGFTFSFVAVLILTGCASTKTEIPPQMTQDLVNLRDQLVQGKASVQTACNAARDLIQRPQADSKSQVDRLNQAITALERQATNNRTQFATADAHAEAYFAHWNQELHSMSSSLADAGKDRRDASMRSFTELEARVERLKGEFRPFMSQLNEVSRYLQVDTTSEGMKTITPQIKSVLGHENSIMSKADAVIEQIDAMRGGK